MSAQNWTDTSDGSVYKGQLGIFDGVNINQTTGFLIVMSENGENLYQANTNGTTTYLHLISNQRKYSVNTTEGRTSTSVTLNGFRIHEHATLFSGSFTMPQNSHTGDYPYLSGVSGALKANTFGSWTTNDLVIHGQCVTTANNNVWLLGATNTAALSGKTVYVRFITFDVPAS